MSNVEYDPHRSVSNTLTEVRTVLSRAETALFLLVNSRNSDHYQIVVEPEHFVKIPGQSTRRYVPAVRIPHPDVDEMIERLETVIDLLSPWRRVR